MKRSYTCTIALGAAAVFAGCASPTADATDVSSMSLTTDEATKAHEGARQGEGQFGVSPEHQERMADEFADEFPGHFADELAEQLAEEIADEVGDRMRAARSSRGVEQQPPRTVPGAGEEPTVGEHGPIGEQGEIGGPGQAGEIGVPQADEGSTGAVQEPFIVGYPGFYGGLGYGGLGYGGYGGYRGVGYGGYGGYGGLGYGG